MPTYHLGHLSHRVPDALVAHKAVPAARYCVLPAPWHQGVGEGDLAPPAPLRPQVPLNTGKSVQEHREAKNAGYPLRVATHSPPCSEGRLFPPPG